MRSKEGEMIMNKFRITDRDGYHWLTFWIGDSCWWLYRVGRIGDCIDGTGRRA